jgi:transposase
VKGVKIDVELYEQIRHLSIVEGLSQRAIANRLNISRNTVSKYCDGTYVPWERKSYTARRPPVITDEVRNFIFSCFDEDNSHNVKKQKHTATRIHQRLQEELSFNGSESNIRKVVRALRDQHNDAFIPLEFDPGEAAQIDFGTAYAYIKGVRRTIKIFCMRLCYSGHFFVKSFYAENEECFLEGHIAAFEFFHGTPKRIIFDNAKVVVKEGLGAYVKQEAKRYLELKAHYAFLTNYCNPSSGHEKGLVENLVGYVRRNTLVPMPKVDSLEQLNTVLIHKCKDYVSHTIKGRTGTVGENYDLEKSSLLPLPRYSYHAELAFYTQVNTYSLVTFKTNKYSVPTEYAGKEVLVKASATNISVYYKSTIIATHERSYLQHEKKYDIDHYLTLLEARPRALFNTAPVRQFVPKEILQSFVRQPNGQQLLLAHLKSSNATKETSEITVIPTKLHKYDQLIKEVSI